MKRRSAYSIRGFMKDFLSVGIFIFLFFYLCSCEPATRYKTLSVFFDGVPNPEEETAANVGGNGEQKPKLPAATYKKHGPFAARLCSACHEVGTNQLRLPVEELCLFCHNLQLNKKFVHGPVAAGGCKICHDPHGSSFPYFLVSESRSFCFRCHNERDIEKNKVHRGVKEECIECHDAHTSNKRYLLR